MTYEQFLKRIAKGERRDDGRTLAMDHIRINVRDGLPIISKAAFNWMQAAVSRDREQISGLLEAVTDFGLLQPDKVIPSDWRGDDDDYPGCKSWSIYVHADRSLSLHLYFRWLEATDHLPTVVARYGLLLMALAASKRRTARELVIGFHEASVDDSDLEKLKTPPPFVPVSLPPIGQGVAGILAMTWSDVVIGRSEAA